MLDSVPFLVSVLSWSPRQPLAASRSHNSSDHPTQMTVVYKNTMSKAYHGSSIGECDLLRRLFSSTTPEQNGFTLEVRPLAAVDDTCVLLSLG